MHSNFYEVRISKTDPVVTRAPPGMQNMSKNMAKMSNNEHLARANKAPDGPNRPPAWPRGESVCRNPSGGASVTYFFYSSRLGYFENILARPFDEGRGPLLDGRRRLFSNGFVFEK
jgi:hypothetical protein